MQARMGDRVVIEGHRVGTPPRRGQVLGVAGSTLTVQWEDGHESVFVPGSDCRVEREADADAEAARVDRLGATIELRVTEDRDHCDAVATLMTQRGTFEGRGNSRRKPDDPSVPMIGEELAIGRALRELSDQLVDDGMTAAARGETRTPHLLG